MNNHKAQRIGSLIRLLPEYEERYIILHKHTFTGVLDSIRRAHIRNYSIFLKEGLLFSHLEYAGEDYAGDMAAIADPITREWWKLTDPMQVPLESRKPGEWWARMELLREESRKELPPPDTHRFAYCGNTDNAPINGREIIPAMRDCGFQNPALFRLDRACYLYMEHDEDPVDPVARAEKQLLSKGLLPMREVFHTDGEIRRRKVFVTGCFDMLHSGHVAFLREAAGYGDLFVCIGNDENVAGLKGRYPSNSQEERQYMISALGCVKECRINSSRGIMDFLKEIEEIKPDIFIVNEDGNTPAKAALCREKGIEYHILKRVPHGSLPPRSTTALRTECTIPYRIDLAGGWLDQPFVSRHHSGSVITISIEPTFEFNDRSGMASSTRRKALELWKTGIPRGDRQQLARILFSYENPPGTKEVAGAQDALGIVLPGLNKHEYRGDYWPCVLESVHDPEILDWLENHLHLITLGPRDSGFVVLDRTHITVEGARRLAAAAEACWQAILARDLAEFGRQFRNSFEAQIAMFPNMVDEEILTVIDQYREMVPGWKLSGAGGGGYLILVSGSPIPGAMKIRIRRKEEF